MSDQINNKRIGFIFTVFFIFANFIAFANQEQSLEFDSRETKLEYDWKTGSEGPAYEVPEKPRDPFFPADTPEFEGRTEAVDKDLIRSSVKVAMVSSSAAGNSAILNQQLVWSGETVLVEVVGKEIALKILKIDLAEPSVVVGYESEEIRIPAGAER